MNVKWGQQDIIECHFSVRIMQEQVVSTIPQRSTMNYKNITTMMMTLKGRRGICMAELLHGTWVDIHGSRFMSRQQGG